MRYKTTIEVITEADSKNEAADIAGEFLRGDINAGADLKVMTASVVKSRAIKAILAICLTSAVLSAALVGNHVYYKIARAEKRAVTSYAIQPPHSKDLKAIWEKEQKDRINSMAR